MKRGFYILLCCVGALSLSGCISLNPTAISRNGPLEGYKYFYVTPTAERNSVYGTTYYGIGSTYSNSVSPSELIASYLMNLGYVRVPEIKTQIANQTMIINYGDGNSRHNSGEAAIEVTIQILNAETNELICICRADSKANNEANAIRSATEKCLYEIFRR